MIVKYYLFCLTQEEETVWQTVYAGLFIDRAGAANKTESDAGWWRRDALCLECFRMRRPIGVYFCFHLDVMLK